MIDVWTMAALVASVGAGVCAGALFAFSSFVMPALGALPPAEAIGAMQAINRAAPSPSFMAVLFGPGLLLVVLLVGGGELWRVPPVWGAAGLYLFGVVGMTAFWHVPLNNGLDQVNPMGCDAAAVWTRYAQRWTTWNHARAFAAALTCGLLGVGVL